MRQDIPGTSAELPALGKGSTLDAVIVDARRASIDDDFPTSIWSSHDWFFTHAPRLTATSPRKEAYRKMHSLSGMISSDTLRPGQLVTSEEREALTRQEQYAQESSSYASRKFPTDRRVIRRPIVTPQEASDAEVTEWFRKSGPKLGPLIPEDRRMSHMRVWYTYRDCGATSISDMRVPTDLYVHKVRLRQDVQPWNRSKRRQWTDPQKYWLNKITSEMIENGMYEPTVTANGGMSDWNAQPVLVSRDREDETGEISYEKEPRLTINYGKVEEDLPGTNLPLLADIHDQLSRPQIGAFAKFDLKHGYWAISVHEDYRHILAFEIPGFPQLQPTRMPQGTQSAGHSFCEAMNIAFGPIPEPLPEPSFLAPPDNNPGSMQRLLTYIDDLIARARNVEELLDFVENDFLPRISWALLKLSLKKCEIGMEEVDALGDVYKTGGRTHITNARSARLRDWAIPLDVTGVRSFLGAIGPTRRFIRNFAETARPLSRLTGNVDWQWGPAEALAFEALRERCSTVVDMHGYDPTHPTRMFVDASGWAAGCYVEQLIEKVPKPIMYDSFLFTKTQRNYGTYKRELFGIVEFIRKHRRYFSCGNPVSVIYTDHKPLTFFRSSPNVEGIYARWADELRSVPVQICYIEGKRNKVADALSRTIFPDQECQDVKHLEKYGSIDELGRWVWKDGKGGYDELIADLSPEETDELVRKLCAADQKLPQTVDTEVVSEASRMWKWSDDPETGYLGMLKGMMHQEDADATEEEMWKALEAQLTLEAQTTLMSASSSVTDLPFLRSPWYSDIWETLSNGVSPDRGRLGSRALLERCKPFRIRSGILEHCRNGVWRRCLLEHEVARALQEAHDMNGHFSTSITLNRLNQSVFWPMMSKDTGSYILGCLQCARFNPARPKAPDLPKTICEPLQIVVTDYVGPLVTSGNGNQYILCIVDSFSSYGWAYATKDTKSATTLQCFRKWMEECGTQPLAVYSDPGSAFIGNEFCQGVMSMDIYSLNSPATSHKSVGLVEVFNRISQTVLSKSVATERPDDPPSTSWDIELPKIMRMMNSRFMEKLGMSPFQLTHGYPSRGSFELKFPTSREFTLLQALKDGTYVFPEGEHKLQLQIIHAGRIQYSLETARQENENDYALRLARHSAHQLRRRMRNDFPSAGDLAMVVQEGKRGKLMAKWRGPFRVRQVVGRMSVILENLNATEIQGRNEYHVDSIKPFIPRTGHLRLPGDYSLPFKLELRRPRLRLMPRGRIS